uniref:Lipid A biosynthesis acyltransferase n=1 Tax=candidate division WOR-3 bacterium TaxID=2052148 RepID=A0A7C4CAX7_UNCW3
MARRERSLHLTWLMPLCTLVQFMLPRWVVVPIARLVGRVLYVLDSRQRLRLIENYRHILGPDVADARLQAYALQAMTYLVVGYADLLRVPVMKRRVSRIADFDARQIDAVLAGGRGAVLVTPHLGNWDLAGVFMGARGYPISAVVELIPRGWTATFNRYRNATAMETIPIPDHRAIARALERGRLLALVADRDLTGRGIPLPAFDAIRSYPKGPAAYALRYGLPVVVGYFVHQRKPGRPPYVGAIGAPLNFRPSGDADADIPALTRLIAHELNRLIARYPEQWLVFNAGWQ